MIKLTRDTAEPTISTEEILAAYGEHGFRGSLSTHHGSFTRLSKTSLGTRSNRSLKREQV